MRKLKISAFITLAIVVVVLAITTLLDSITGIPGTSNTVYGSVPFCLMWALLAILATAYIIRRRLWRAPATLMIHVSFLVILIGALTTHILGEQGTMRVRKDAPTPFFILKDGQTAKMPFRVALDDFQIKYYEGTSTAEDFISSIEILDGEHREKGRVSMNRIFSYRDYRFYQAGYDPDQTGTVFSISHDPYGIAITYTGYLLLLLSMALFFFQPGSQFRRLLKGKAAAAVMLLALIPAQAGARNMPKIASTEVAEAFSGLYISYNGRVCPVGTFAHDFTTKLYGKPTYRGRKSPEILAGWIFYPNTWKPEPMIKVKGGRIRKILGVDSRYAALTDFANRYGEYKLQPLINDINSGKDVEGASAIRAANEKISIINSVFTGSSLKIFPLRSPHGRVTWLSPVDDLPEDLDFERWNLIRKSLDLLAEKIITGKNDEALEIIEKIRQYQIKECAEHLPGETEYKAEMLYNRISSSRIWAMACVTIGIVAFIYYTVRTARRKTPSRRIVILLNVAMACVWAYLTLCIGLRTAISHHLPLSNGFETMQALSWICLTLTFFLQRKIAYALPFAFIIGGMALLVAMMGQSNPAVTSLTPVLNSPLLSMHVMVIMIAYSLLAFIMLNGITALVLSRMKGGMEEEVENLRRKSLLMLYPAVFLLTAGIFIGAVWANVSWGRYWGWDAKEVWALITMLIYAVPLHSQSIGWLRDARNFHLYATLAFLAVLMTYFGANFFLAGLHSYA